MLKLILLLLVNFKIVHAAEVAQCQENTYTKEFKPVTQKSLLTCALSHVNNYQKTKTCIRDKRKVTDECAGCFSDFIKCAATICVGFGAPCGFMANAHRSAECATCVTTICQEPFMQCSGLSGLPPK